MICQATVQLASMNPAPYSVNHVDRKAVFVFDAGRKIHELFDPRAGAGSCSHAARRRKPYRYWPRFDSVSMARDALDDLPVTSVRM